MLWLVRLKQEVSFPGQEELFAGKEIDVDRSLCAVSLGRHLPTGWFGTREGPSPPSATSASALHYKAYKALARAIVEFNHSIASLCE